MVEEEELPEATEDCFADTRGMAQSSELLMHDDNCADMEDRKKRKRSTFIKTSVGNQFKLRQQSRAHFKIRNDEKDLLVEDISPAEAIDLLRGQRQCCSSGGEYGCIMKNLMNGNAEMWTEGINFLKQCRRVTMMKSLEERQEFMYDNYVESLKQNRISLKSQLMDAKVLRLNRRFTLLKKISVCTTCFLDAYGLSLRHLRKIAQLYKENWDLEGRERRDVVLLNLKHKAWDDDLVHDFTFAETKEIFQGNIVGANPGQCTSYK